MLFDMNEKEGNKKELTLAYLLALGSFYKI